MRFGEIFQKVIAAYSVVVAVYKKPSLYLKCYSEVLNIKRHGFCYMVLILHFNYVMYIEPPYVLLPIILQILLKISTSHTVYFHYFS